ncbi:zinc finger CCCH-type antiviral protein 1-like isoform X2 [Rhineura floridana]|uniref:zinc finger CCCH-type antiviral protein 1-like isoform X2 n=1 Tax=Rhineura floridana TaxID=261503 RepID=UPI002AC84BED|nr:zinc finger CCCH-type antiviral protein 1-like isoform X2 [Rhineura floridana]
MSDPVVCSFITKVLCASGGRLDYGLLPEQVELPEQQLRQILEDVGQERFLMHKQGSTTWVLAVSSIRVCVRMECQGCDHLHLCKLNLAGRCKSRACKYHHDVFSEANRKILKNHELSGLNENELHVLLLQNDPFLLPDVCSFYNKGDGNCVQQDNCTKLHICRYFLRGQCRFPRCKRSHNLLQPNALKLLLEGGVDNKMAWNIQTICNHKTAVLAMELGPCRGFSSSTRPAASGEKSSTGSWRESRPEQAYDVPNLMNLNLGPGQGIKAAPSSKSHQNTEKEKSDEICLYYVWQFCKNKNNCNMIHYDLPYRWQIYTGNGWKDLAKREEIEKAYCDPSTICILDPYINFKSMTSNLSPVRRLCTPSSVTKPAKFVMTTKWLWYWKNDLGQWVEYGKEDGQLQGSILNSDDLENLFLVDPSGSIPFTAGSQQYEINFKDMTQRNVLYQTKREIQRRPKFVSSEDVKTKKGHTNHVSASTPSTTYPNNWDKSALPAVGYKAVELIKMSPEYTKIENLFQKTMKEFVIQRITRIQNPSLWQIFQWQKEQMKKKSGQAIDERLLFHGTTSSSLEAICNDNFDWRICGTNGTVFGKGSYFARDAQYSNNYCKRNAKVKTMFVAQVLVGDFVIGNATYTRPPAKSVDMVHCYDSCVDNLVDPSIFVIFEKHQIYPAYLIYYSEEEKKCVLS